jgi:hypothetical protein
VAQTAAALWAGQEQPPLLTSFEPEALAGAQASAPHLPRGLLLETLWPGWLARAQALGCVAVVCEEGLWDAALMHTACCAGLRTLAYTVNDAATAQRLTSLSERISRTSALLRTRVDIATEEQNSQLLEKLTKGQAMQLRLQTTVEGLSIAAISYYVISLLLYLGKAGKAAGLPIHPEMAAGALVPLVLWVVWRTNKRIHDKVRREE